MPFNTLYQLAASRGTAELETAATMLLTPDLIGYWLTGAIGAEETMASTTACLMPDMNMGARPARSAFDLPVAILPAPGRPGEA